MAARDGLVTSGQWLKTIIIAGGGGFWLPRWAWVAGSQRWAWVASMVLTSPEVAKEEAEGRRLALVDR